MVGQELYQSATDMCRMGGTVILKVGDSVQAVSPESWYVLAEGGHVIVSFSDLSAQAYTPRTRIVWASSSSVRTHCVKQQERGFLLSPSLGRQSVPCTGGSKAR